MIKLIWIYVLRRVDKDSTTAAGILRLRFAAALVVYRYFCTLIESAFDSKMSLDFAILSSFRVFTHSGLVRLWVATRPENRLFLRILHFVEFVLEVGCFFVKFNDSLLVVLIIFPYCFFVEVCGSILFQFKAFIRIRFNEMLGLDWLQLQFLPHRRDFIKPFLLE